MFLRRKPSVEFAFYGDSVDVVIPGQVLVDIQSKVLGILNSFQGFLMDGVGMLNWRFLLSYVY